MNNLTVLILAGGSGTRFWPLTTDKILFPFFGKPLSAYTVGRVLPKQTANIVVVTNEFNNKELAAFTFPIPHLTVIQKESKGMADAILSAESEIAHKPLLILIADDLADPMLFQNIVNY